ncbi:RsmB/NOP family class I SAM-dependent RNA methyltransferase [Anianabacter salinae]|uniref:RsmB/NOP family class I SAM-dependent RNA methyltransferase n=1 Tax=Anianabacter salinae TaxID=2851023 RepID=UPI00225DDC23|nr:transcription antitermination factor NusB [Anianabacter salinae]MBV0913368.1 methyltransferase domain-containing protein [Anianabacter salinae]
MSKPGLAPRRSALFLLGRVTVHGQLLSELLPGAVERLEPADRARAQRLATDTLRWMDRADRLLGPYLKRRPKTEVLNALRLGVTEICEDGAAPHGVVDAMVTLRREGKHTESAAGLVNAVLRKVGTDGPAKWVTLPVPRLPKWLRAPLVDAWGKEAVAAMEAAHAAGAQLDLTPRDGDAAALADLVSGIALPTGSVRLGDPGQVTALPGYADGAWWVQDAAAAIPARLLDARAGERVLDMCAAPGGKTMQLAASGAAVTALDLSEGRMARVAENLARTGLKAEIAVADALSFDAAPFDAILLDAPCSATGTLRRHPDLPQAKDGSDFGALFALQEAMIDRALALLKPGGRLVYCTCSLLPDEGEVAVEEALARHPSLALDTGALCHDWIEDGWRGETGLRLRPDFWADRGGMDGFYIACLRKTAG